MTAPIHVHFLPDWTSHQSLAGHAVVVIDVLRASTTIVAALAAGAASVVPCLDVSEARRLARTRPGALLGGERGGRPIPGFDLGNSPRDYTAERVRGRTIVFTTTNGTRALARCIGSQPVLIGAFSNLTVITETLRTASGPVHLLCAGTDGQVSREDVLLAGAITDRLVRGAGRVPSDAADIARAAWLACEGGEPSAAALADALRNSWGGRNLVELGMEADIDWAAVIDRAPIVPRLNSAVWTIMPSIHGQGRGANAEV